MRMRLPDMHTKSIYDNGVSGTNGLHLFDLVSPSTEADASRNPKGTMCTRGELVNSIHGAAKLGTRDSVSETTPTVLPSPVYRASREKVPGERDCAPANSLVLCRITHGSKQHSPLETNVVFEFNKRSLCGARIQVGTVVPSQYYSAGQPEFFILVQLKIEVA